MASGLGHGSMSLSMKLIRFLIIIFNVAFIIIGITLLALGIYIFRSPQIQQLRPLFNADSAKTNSDNLSTIEIFAIVLMAIGIVAILLGLLGCFGAFKAFKFLHLIYAIVIAGLIIAEIGTVIVFAIYESRFESKFVNALRESIINNYVGTPLNNKTSANSISTSWDFLQFNLKCCGAINKTDYTNALHWNRTNPYAPNTALTVPFTCCPLDATKNWNTLPKNMTTASTCATTGVNAYARGCFNRLVDLLNTYKNHIIIGLIMILVLEILAFLFAILLFRRKKEYYAI